MFDGSSGLRDNVVMLALALAVGLSVLQGDACAPLVPLDLAKTLAKTYPDYRLPRGSDQDESNVNAQVEKGGPGCLGVAKGDFDGDGRPDLALLLSRADERWTRCVVALRRDSAWRVELLAEAFSPIGSQYVDVVAPGSYVSGFYGGEYGPPEKDQREKIQSPVQGVATGTLESTAIYYFRLKGHWVWLWMAD